ncbi:MAG: excisionase family DNA-binding protein [Candidatus Peribacteria bacterium]|nr:excisionase family DNA-binding protein [Candidatus Peribacteria bacterium]
MQHYSLTRDKASVLLGVSTRTIDRYIKSGRLSYKKVGNKVLLSRDELATLH